jgi:hypothetical protein
VTDIKSGKASLERVTTLTLSDSEVTMTPDGKRLTNSVKDHLGKLIPFLEVNRAAAKASQTIPLAILKAIRSCYAAYF